MTIQDYIKNIDILYKSGKAREHSYRPDLQKLLATLLPNILITNEPARIECGAPDFLLSNKDIPIGYIEAKDIGIDLKSKTLKEQFDRYRTALDNLIFTDYMDFHFYKKGEFVKSIAIAKIENNAILPLSENFKGFEDLIIDFAQIISQSITSPSHLAELMAAKARLMANVIEQSLDEDDKKIEENFDAYSALQGQRDTFNNMLIEGITNREFSDIYAQTIAYGMFAARYNDSTLETFSRVEAADLIPKSNPFLRKLFQDIASHDLDTRLVWIVDDLVSIFLATDVVKLMKNYGRSTKQEDAIVHFYETFLAEYNPALRKARGVWYTPQPVVNFIVRGVDEILKNEFDLPKGLADTSKTQITRRVETQVDNGKKAKIKEVDTKVEVHKVQILDPATGTGTFLAEVVKHIHKKFKGQEGIWSQYVKTDLIPRLNGFELLMASYAMAHLQMEILLAETGYKATDNQRFRIYLTNSLEEPKPPTDFNIFSKWLADEANQANAIKNETPVMVILGNPPYSGESKNQGDWIMKLMEDYKKEPGGLQKLQERNPKWINDDYVKFMRFAQYFIEKNGFGILAFINPHGFLDNPTFRGMRWNLLKTYDSIYTIDLHGNSKKKEVSPDGSPDQNVFDIMQGVSINFFIKKATHKKTSLGKVFHAHLYGKRDDKYSFLNKNALNTINWKQLTLDEKNYFFVPKDFQGQEHYEKGFKIDELFINYSSGITTERDNLVVSFDKRNIENLIQDFHTLEIDSLRAKHDQKPDGRDWRYSFAKNDIKLSKGNFITYQYRPFDYRFIYYTGKSKGIIAYPRFKTMSHMLNSNLALQITSKNRQISLGYMFISKWVSDRHLLDSAADSMSVFPLYTYPETNNVDLFEEVKRSPNLNSTLVKKIAETLALPFVGEKEFGKGSFAPIDILDYIYAVLHSPTYREKYKEFLKIDFPRVPYPKDAPTFWEMVAVGKSIRNLHLLESEEVENYITQYPIDGDNIVTKPNYKDGNVYINDTQYFANVPQIAWEFFIGGYQPAQKWLKDRKDRQLSFDDILHYQQMIVALFQTHNIMQSIDNIDFM